MNDMHDETHNPIFEVINNIDTRRHHTPFLLLLQIRQFFTELIPHYNRRQPSIEII
jgi:hypothetical protein